MEEKFEIYAKQTDKVIQYIEIPYYDETSIYLAKKLRFLKVDRIPELTTGLKSAGLKAVNQVGIPELIDPLKKKIIHLLEDPAWVYVLYNAVQKEISAPTVAKTQQ
ncbi:MAG: hypothetical protein V2B20_06630 [Pseudomonadota bacterium]